MGPYSLTQRVAAEFLGTALLLATVIGSGIMGAKLSAGNDALALLGNTLPTGAILVVLITVFGPVSGAHFNPAVSGVFWLRGETTSRLALLYVVAQVCGGLVGVIAAHAMFDLLAGAFVAMLVAGWLFRPTAQTQSQAVPAE